MSRGSKGAVTITLHSNSNDIGEKAEVTVSVKNPEHAVERMLHTLAQRFPPESVVTITPAPPAAGSPVRGSTSSSSAVPTSTEGSRSSSLSGGELSAGPTVALSPELRRSMTTLSPELTGWILSQSPSIYPGLLDLASRNGDAKEFAARMGLSPEPVETVVQQLMQDADFFEWLSEVSQQATKSTKVRRAHTQPASRTGYPGGLPAPAVSMVLKEPSDPKQGYLLLDSSGSVVGHSDGDGNHVLLPATRQPLLYPYAPPHSNNDSALVASRDAISIPKDPEYPEEGSWLVNRAGKVVGHTNSVGRLVMHPANDLSARPSQPSGFAGLNVVPRDPKYAKDGGPWLVDLRGRVVGHYDQKGRPVMHPLDTSQPTVPSPMPGLTAYPMTDDGCWLVNAQKHIVGHCHSSTNVIMHPRRKLPLKNMRSSGVPELHMIPKDPEHPENGGPWLVDARGKVIGHYDRERRPVMHPSDPVTPTDEFTDMYVTQPISPSRPHEGNWLINGQGRIIGHTDNWSNPVFHPLQPLQSSKRTPSGVPGVFVVPREESRPKDGGPWLVDAFGNVVGHYDPLGRAVLQPGVGGLESTDVEGDVPYVAMDPNNPRGPSWVVDSTSGLVFGHVEHPGGPIVHHVINTFVNAARPSGVPGLNIVDGAVPWLVDERGQVLGHLSPEGRARFHPLLPMIPLTNLRRSSSAGNLNELPMAQDGGLWLLDNQQQVVGHQLPTERSVMHPTIKFASASKPTKVQGLRRVSQDPNDPNRRQVSWACDEEGNVIGHFHPKNGDFVLHPKSPRPLMDFGGPTLVEIPKGTGQGNWLLLPTGQLVGHTDAKDRPVMHPRTSLSKSSMVPIGIAGVSLVPRDPQHPEIGGPWLVGDDGFVIGHFEPEGRPLLHPNFKSRLSQTVPSPVVGFQAAYINPDQTSDGVWLMDSEGNVVGHAGLDGTAQMHPTGALHNTVSSSLRGLSITQRDPQNPQQGGPWIVDYRDRPVAHYTADGRLVLHPPQTRWEVNVSPPQSSQTAPSRIASSAGKFSTDEGQHYDETGMRVRYVEVPVIEERVKEVVKREVRELEKRVPKIDYQVREKIVEVPEIRYVERKVSKEVIDEVVRHVPRKEIVDVPKEVIRHVPKLETRVVEKIVEKPEIIEVPKPYKVEQKVTVPRYVNVEKPTVVAQKLRPLIRETGKREIVQAKTYEPMLYAVDVYIPKPVQSAFTAMGRVEETHSLVEIPAPQYNTLLQAMNSKHPEEALTDLFVRGPGGAVPFLPVGELAEIVPPLPSAIIPGRHTASPTIMARGGGAASSRSPSVRRKRGCSRRRRGRSASPSRRRHHHHHHH